MEGPTILSATKEEEAEGQGSPSALERIEALEAEVSGLKQQNEELQTEVCVYIHTNNT